MTTNPRWTALLSAVAGFGLGCAMMPNAGSSAVEDSAGQVTQVTLYRGQALLFVEKRTEAEESVRLSYLVSDCEWSPVYAFRAGPDRKEVRVECNGLIRQRSGEDWNGVQLTLSTASPTLSVSGPGLASFSVGLSQEVAKQWRDPKELAAQLDFKYRLLVENYQPEPAAVRLYDRLPHSRDSAEVRVALAELKVPLSKDPIYLRRQRLKGILRWEITVPAGAVREQAEAIEYGFSAEFDRNLQLSALGGKQEQAEFDLLRRSQMAPAEAAPEPPAPSPTLRSGQYP